MSEFVWAPNKGESEAKYLERVFADNPSLSFRVIEKARVKAHTIAIVTEAPVATIPPPRNQKRELELERELAETKLQLHSANLRIETLQRQVRLSDDRGSSIKME